MDRPVSPATIVDGDKPFAVSRPGLQEGAQIRLKEMIAGTMETTLMVHLGLEIRLEIAIGWPSG
jgi:hypothetical protein